MSGIIPYRALSRSQFQDYLIGQVGSSSILEIGPLNRPLISTPKTKFFDLLPTSELQRKASAEGLDAESVPQIDYSNPQGNLDVITEKFGGIVSSHCIEHQPDLISHFISCARLLEGPEARYYLVIPDKRYCFDHFIPESSLIEILRAHEEKLTKPTIWKVVEHRALTTHNSPDLHWQNNHGVSNSEIKSRIDAAKLEYYSSNGAYIDVHCWQFTPDSFCRIIDALHKLELIDFQMEEIWETKENDLEFFAVLKRIPKGNIYS